MTKNLIIGILQIEATNDKNINIERAYKLIRQYGKVEANVIVFPEYFMSPINTLTPQELYSIAEQVDGEFSRKLVNIAREYNANLIVPIFERSKIYPKVYNTIILIQPNENVRVVYRKIHLFDAYGYRESDYMLKGDKLSEIIELNNTKIAFSVCFDIRFPELYRIYALKGVEVVISPSAWFKGPLKEETIRFLAQARAHENTIYLVIANQTGKMFTGRSFIVDPLGVILLDLGIDEKYYEYTIDVDYIQKVRRILPVLNLRRTDLYKLAPID